MPGRGNRICRTPRYVPETRHWAGGSDPSVFCAAPCFTAGLPWHNAAVQCAAAFWEIKNDLASSSFAALRQICSSSLTVVQ